MATPGVEGTVAFSVAVCCFCWACFSLSGAETTGNSVLWPDYATASRRRDAYTSYIGTYIPIPYFESVATYVKIDVNGFVVFGSSYEGEIPPSPSRWPYSPKILAAFWTYSEFQFVRTIRHQYLYVDTDRLQNVTKTSSLVTYIKTLVNEPEFEPLFAISATWAKVVPDFYGGDFSNDTATFQVIIATDSQVTYAIRGYQTVWQSPELGKRTYHSTAYSLGYGQRPHLSILGNQTGPEVIKLSTKTPNKNVYDCVVKVQAIRITLNSSLTNVHPCPCHKVQADRDTQFQVSQSSSTCYQSRSPMPGSTLLQVCCYNEFGIVIYFTKEARVPVSVDSSDRSLQETYEKCCDGGLGLCRWFYSQIPSTKCTNNMTLLGVSELPRFTSNPSELTMNANDRYQQRFQYKSQNPVTFSLLTALSSTHGISLTTSGFNWYIGAGLSELRKLSYPQKLIFYLIDTKTNLSAFYAPLFKLCLCERPDQCSVNSFPAQEHSSDFEPTAFYGLDKDDRGNVNAMNCECKGNGTGRYCEKPVNPCDDCLVERRHDCASSPMDYCPPCPVGYQREGPQCLVTGLKEEDNNCHSITRVSALLFTTLLFLSTSGM